MASLIPTFIFIAFTLFICSYPIVKICMKYLHIYRTHNPTQNPKNFNPKRKGYVKKSSFFAFKKFAIIRNGLLFHFTLSECLFYSRNHLFLFILLRQRLDHESSEVCGLPSRLESPDGLVLDSDGVHSLRLIKLVDLSGQPCFGRRKDAI